MQFMLLATTIFFPSAEQAADAPGTAATDQFAPEFVEMRTAAAAAITVLASAEQARQEAPFGALVCVQVTPEFVEM